MLRRYLRVATALSAMLFCAIRADSFDDMFNAGTVSNDTPDNTALNFNFGNAGDGSVNGDDLWNSGQEVPIQNPQGWDLDPVTPSVTPGITPSVFCHPNYCQVYNPCNGSSKCVNTQECNRTLCQLTSPGIKTKTTALPLKNKELPENNCLDVSNIDCQGPDFCFDLFYCECKPGFDGFMCLQKCGLNCVPGQGLCKISKNVSNHDQDYQYCNCFQEWEGDLCNVPVVDPKVAASKAREKEEKARILAAVLAAAAAVVLCIAIAMPIVLWRMRVIFVLKLVYFFKPYDDGDSKLYDAYVSMTSTSNAEKFVYHELRPKLESRGFKLYLQARDNCPGNALSEDIIEAVENSRCTIMIVTQDYISNEWNRFEYLIAQHESLKLKQRIIPIILEKLDKKTTLDKVLKHILDSVKCLKYPQQNIPQSPSNESKPSIQEIHFISSMLCKKSSQQKSCDISTEEEKKKKMFKAEDKFWQCLELTMPKIKKPKNITNNNPEKPSPLHESVFHQMSIQNNIYTVNEKCNSEFGITDVHLDEITV